MEGQGADPTELPSLLPPPAACLVGPKLGKNKETVKKIGRPCSFPTILAEKIRKQRQGAYGQQPGPQSHRSNG